MSLTSQKMIWKLVHMTFGSYVYSLFHFSEFLKIFWALFEFSWFYLIYFWFLVVTCSYASLDDIHASFEIFGILYEQWSQFKVEIVKVGKILGCLKFGCADGPWVRGGRSAGHRCNRSASDTLVVCPLSRARTVRPGSTDSPPVLKKNLPEVVSVRDSC